MAINRAPWTALVDDDGSNLVGTVWNKDKIKTVLLDPIDAMVTYGTVTLVDVSGAGLVFSYAQGFWSRYDRLVTVAFQVVYPATANTAVAAIGGLPVAPAEPGAVGVQGLGVARQWSVPSGSQAAYPYNLSSGAAMKNNEMSGANIIVSFVYKTT